MSNFYSDSKFGVINRKWFGLVKKMGGDSATGYTFAATKGATTTKHLVAWYPRGPIKMMKAGSFCIATITNASVDLYQARIRTRGASASTGCTWYLKSTATAVAENTVASTTTFTVSQVKAGEYVAIDTATPTTDKATAVAATTTGTLAFFIDYVPTYDPTGKWDS